MRSRGSRRSRGSLGLWGLVGLFALGAGVAVGEVDRPLGVSPGPSVAATRGGVWPRPSWQITGNNLFIVRPNVFRFMVMSNTCDILEKAILRYKQDLKSLDKIRRLEKTFLQGEGFQKTVDTNANFWGYIDTLEVFLYEPCEDIPQANMTENYSITLHYGDFYERASLMSYSIWGILRGLETWSQLVHFSPEFNALVVYQVSLSDEPRFPHRGLLIDTSRHFLPLKTIYSVLDAMAMSKMNVLHWHVVDDQSFPFQSSKFPQLSSKGAYAPSHVYTPSDVQGVVSYATLRGIRVISEFDTPGHTRSWGQGYPHLLTECYDKKGKPDGSLGPMNPISPDTYHFMNQFLAELKNTFPDWQIHLGGDEVDFRCWESNPNISQFMKDEGLTPKGLEGMFVNKIIQMAKKLEVTPIVWQEIFDDGVALPNDTVIQIWKTDHLNKMNEITKKGYKVLLSSCWYLDNLESGGDWRRFYLCDPHSFPGNEHQKSLVLGGEACMWGEAVDSTNILPRVWPRASAVAERLWFTPLRSNITVNITEAAQRLEEHTCRMIRRKIPAQPPNGPGFCPGLNYR